MKDALTRRHFLKIGLGSVGTLTAAQSLAQVCGLSTGEQPLGPFFPREGTPEESIREDGNPSTPIYLANDNDLTTVRGRSGKAEGQVVYVIGKVTDENCAPIPGATLIIWQASESGRYNHLGDSANKDFRHPKTGETVRRKLDPSFQYWGKASTNDSGDYQFKTIVPGFYPADLKGNWYRPPHIHFLISATGFPQTVTQMYFSGKAIADNGWIQELNQKDFLLQSPNISHEQRQKLVVEFRTDSSGQFVDGLVGEFNITLSR